MSRAAVIVGLAALLALSSAAPAGAQATLISALGGTAGFGTNVLPPADDGSSATVTLTPGFPMGILVFGARFNTLFVNGNGNVSFGGALPDYTPVSFPGFIHPMVAPWWADVDTRPGAQPGDPVGANAVYWDLRANQLVVTWYLVGSYNMDVAQRNSFQLVIRQVAGQPAGTVELEFRYNRCEWISGDMPGGVAQAGIDFGNGTTFMALPGANAPDVIASTCGGTNVGIAGVWRFPGGALMAPVCGNHFRETGEQCDPTTPTTVCVGCRFRMPVDAGPPGPVPDASLDASSDGGGDGGGGSSSDDGGGGSGMDGGGSNSDDGGGGSNSDDGGGGSGSMDGSGGGGDGGGGGGPGGSGLDVFGGGCSAARARGAPLTMLASMLVALALAARRRRR